MPIDAQPLLTLAQMFSPGFPVGGFSYSHGLEHWVAVGEVRDAADFMAWLDEVVTAGAGRNDAILLVAAHRAATRADLLRIDDLGRAFSPSAERLLETVAQGEAFSRTVAEVWHIDLPPLCYPVAAGAAARRLRLPLADVARMYLHSVAGNLTAAATRLLPLGQTEAQACLARLAPRIAETAAAAQSAGLDDLGAATFRIDIASMRHETQYSRMFRS